MLLMTKRTYSSSMSSVENLIGLRTRIVFNKTRWITAKGFNSAKDSPPHNKMLYCKLDSVEESPTRGFFARLDFVVLIFL